jgi:hypothetical protein
MPLPIALLPATVSLAALFALLVSLVRRTPLSAADDLPT